MRRTLLLLVCASLLIAIPLLNTHPAAAQGGTITACPNNSLLTAFDTIILPGDCTLSGSLTLSFGMHTIQGNGHTLYASGGRHLTINSGALFLDNVTLANGSSSNGGAIYVQASGSLTLENNSVVHNNRASQFGGAIYNNGGIVVIKNTDFYSNSTRWAGGAIFNTNGGILTVKDYSTLYNNSAMSGGAIYSGVGMSGTGGATDVVVINSTFTGNVGSAITNGSEDPGSIMYVINSTFSGNRPNSSVSSRGGAIVLSGALGVTQGPTYIRNNTFSGNGGTSGTAIYSDLGTVTAANNIMGPSGFSSCSSNGGTFTRTNNLSVDGSCGGGVSAAALNLGPLQYNGGGSVQTMALREGSVAINAGTSGCPDYNNVPLTTDERGKTRPVGGQCDIGAFEYNPHQLTVSVTGSGSVTSDSPGITCGADCDGMFDGYVTLTAAPATGYAVSWGGCTSTSGNTCTVDMSANNRTVTATFAPALYTVDINKSGSGTVTSSPAGIDCGADCAEDFIYGSTVTLTAAPDTGQSVAWGNCTTSSGNTCTVDINASNRTVTALFTPNPYTLSVNKAGDGQGTVVSSPVGIDCGSTCASVYDYGTTVTLTAAATSGLFTGWQGSDATAAGCGTSTVCTITIDQARTVTATFAIPVPESPEPGPPISCDAINFVGGWGIYAEGTPQQTAFTVPDPPAGYSYAASPAYDGYCDVFTVNADHSPLPVQVCWPAAGGSLVGLYHDQPDLTRTWTILPTTPQDGSVCASLPAFGGVALLTGDAPIDTTSAGTNDDLTGQPEVGVDCDVTTTYRINFRATPNGDVITQVMYDVTLHATAESDGWYRVEWLGQTGWISGDYVTADCQ